jgi:hypothetical protein
MTTPQVNPAGALAPVQLSMDQLQHLLQQLYHPPASSNPKVEDLELYYGKFNDSLHIDVQGQLALLDTRPETMIDFAKKAIALNNRLCNFRTLQTWNEPQYYWDYQTGHSRNLEPMLSDPTPMELDTTRRPRGKDRLEEEKRRRNNECYNCGKSGHYSAHCPTKKPYYDRRTYQAAETTVGEASAEEESGKEDPWE